MAAKTYCQFCGEELDLGREFVFMVEAQVYDERIAPLEVVQASEHYHGEPLRVCKECQSSIDENRRDLAAAAEREGARTSRLRRALIVLGVVILGFLGRAARNTHCCY